MKNLILALVLIAAAFFAWRYTKSHGLNGTYQEFAEDMTHRRFDKAAALTDGLSESDLQKIADDGGLNPAMMQTIFPSKFAIESTEKQPDGSVKMTAVHTVLFNPPGVESALRPAMYAAQRQVITLRKAGLGWRITSFKSNVEKMDSVPKAW